jgi:hypothetical protein
MTMTVIRSNETRPTPTTADVTRREWLCSAASGLSSIALASLLDPRLFAAEQRPAGYRQALAGLPHHLPRARRVIFLSQSGAPSQLDLFDAKPGLLNHQGQELPDSVRRGQPLTTMTSGQASKPIAPSRFTFARHGQCGAEISELLPQTASVADELCIVRSLHTDAINHDPAMTLLQTGVPNSGHPRFGAWVSYGLGNESDELPTFVVMFSGGDPGDQPLSARLWGSAFLASQHQGVRLQAGSEPVLYLSNPPGVSTAARREMHDSLRRLNERQFQRRGDPETLARISQFEMAYHMQAAVPELVDLSSESACSMEMYGDDAQTPGTYAHNCLLARRLVERGVRFIQLYHRGWDHHDHLADRLTRKCRQTDQASAALVKDLRQRGLLDETLIVWAGEFGRTVFCQGDLSQENYGRDHHPRCFSAWLSGGGIRAGLTHGQTDEFSYQVVDKPVHVRDLHATMLHLLGVDHERLTVRFQGRDQRLTDIGGTVIRDMLA